MREFVAIAERFSSGLKFLLSAYIFTYYYCIIVKTESAD